jgi:hypothetical protein
MTDREAISAFLAVMREPLLLSALGERLRRELGRSPRELGFPSLKALIQGYPDHGRLSGTGGDIMYIPTAAREVHADPVPHRLLVAVLQSEQAWLDRARGTIAFVCEADADPLRYAPVPTLDRERLTELASAWASEQMKEELRPAFVDAVLANTLDAQFASVGVEWAQWLKQRVADDVRAWLAAHGVHASHHLEAPQRPAQTSRSRQATSRSFLPPESELRARVLAAVARLTDDELAELRLPARVLMAQLPVEAATRLRTGGAVRNPISQDAGSLRTRHQVLQAALRHVGFWSQTSVRHRAIVVLSAFLEERRIGRQDPPSLKELMVHVREVLGQEAISHSATDAALQMLLRARALTLEGSPDGPLVAMQVADLRPDHLLRVGQEAVRRLRQLADLDLARVDAPELSRVLCGRLDPELVRDLCDAITRPSTREPTEE